jgi:predicted cupin superfamily sugar epimerase
MDVSSCKALIARLGLQPHPEGGWYRETHRSSVLGAEGRCAATSILFLLEHPHVSHLHRIDAEELWYWHAGTALDVHVLGCDGTLATHRLGSQGAFQLAVPKGLWFGAEPPAAGDWALVGCAVAPGFEFSGFKLATREALLLDCPRHEELIRRLT